MYHGGVCSIVLEIHIIKAPPILQFTVLYSNGLSFINAGGESPPLQRTLDCIQDTWQCKSNHNHHLENRTTGAVVPTILCSDDLGFIKTGGRRTGWSTWDRSGSPWNGR